MSKVANWLGRTVFVSMPNLNGSEQPRPFKLLGVEACGLWLEDLSGAAFKAPEGCSPGTAMVPFAQIAYILCGGTHRLNGKQAEPVGGGAKPHKRQDSKEEKRSTQGKHKT